MESRISIQNNSPAPIPPKKRLKELIDRICGTLADNQAGIELVFMTDEQIRPYYKEYFGEDRATDVLAFPLEGARVAPSTGKALGPIAELSASGAPEVLIHASPSRSPCSLGDDEEIIGSIVISIETAARQAEEHGQSLWEEVRFLIIHGFLHLLGYDHGEPEEKSVMQAQEQELLALTASI